MLLVYFALIKSSDLEENADSLKTTLTPESVPHKKLFFENSKGMPITYTIRLKITEVNLVKKKKKKKIHAKTNTLKSNFILQIAECEQINDRTIKIITKSN